MIDECAALTALGLESKAVWGYAPEAMAVFRDELTVPESDVRDGHVFVYVRDEQIVGYYTLKPVAHDCIELAHLFVDPQHLRDGIGKRLFQHAEIRSRDLGFLKLVIQSDPNAAGFYQKLGVSMTGEIPSSIPGRSIPCFELSLNAG